MGAIVTKRSLDPKAARMLAIFANQPLRSLQVATQLRLTLLTWRLRLRIVSRAKRSLDLALASLLLVVTAPLMLLAMLAIRLDSPGPLLFRQTRIGRWGQPFTCYKFRSMYIDAEQRLNELLAFNEADGPVFKMRHDPRVTRVGRVLRKLSIDELPQLFNVLRGEMSLVGPRPALLREVDQYTYDQARRLLAAPGITGLQQVSGRSNVDFTRWIELDLEYIADQGVRKDIEILLKTIPAVLWSKGAY